MELLGYFLIGYLITAFSASMTYHLVIYRPAIAIFEEVTELQFNLKTKVSLALSQIVIGMFMPGVYYFIFANDNQTEINKLVNKILDSYEETDE